VSPNILGDTVKLIHQGNLKPSKCALMNRFLREWYILVHIKNKKKSHCIQITSKLWEVMKRTQPCMSISQDNNKAYSEDAVGKQFQ